MDDRFRDPSLLGQGQPQARLCRRVERVDSQRLAVVRDGLVEPPGFGQRQPQNRVRQIVVLGHAQGVLEEGERVLPSSCLKPGREPAREAQSRRERGEGAGVQAPPAEHLRSPPSRNHEEADTRDVGVAIGHRLVPDLNQTDDRNQRDDVPSPSRRQIGMAPAPAQDQRRQADHDQRRQRDLP